MSEQLNNLIETANRLNSVDKVYFINEVFGNKFGDNRKSNLINQAKNLYDELDELQEAIDTNDGKEVVDAIGDLLTFAYGICYFEGMNCIGTHNIVPDASHGGNLELKEVIWATTETFINEVESDKAYQETLYDLISYIKGLCVHNNVDEELLMSRITKSNLTKVCATAEDMTQTVEKYTAMGVDVYAKYFEVRGFWIYVVYSAREQKVDNKVYRENKFLKCVHFEDPVLDDLVVS